MARGATFDKIELSLVRVFHTVITERSVSRAALRLATSQPAVSAQLKRLRALTGDPLLVRSGAGMAPTAVALSSATYPVWRGTVNLPANTAVEYKYVKKNGSTVAWESGANRTLNTGSACTLTVNDTWRS